MPCTVCRKPVVFDGYDWLFAGSSLIHNRATCPGPDPFVVELVARL